MHTCTDDSQVPDLRNRVAGLPPSSVMSLEQERKGRGEGMRIVSPILHVDSKK